MANIRAFGTIPSGFAIQPGSELIYHDSGLIEGTVTFKRDASGAKDAFKSLIGRRLAQDTDVFVYAMRKRSLPLSLSEATFDCIGTTGYSAGTKETERIVVPLPSKEMIPIEAHPEFFSSDFAGPESSLTLSADGNFAEGANGARFSVIPGQRKITGFLGFIGPSAPQKLRPVRYYESNTPVLRATWFSWLTPTFNFKSVIIAHPKGAPDYAGIKNWLRSSPPAERVGKVNGIVLWKITQEYVGSEDGWNDKIYPVEKE